MGVLDGVNSPDCLKQMKISELDALCGEIRELLLESVSVTGGHLASNMGVVELTVALHRVFNSPEDALIFDVSHQCYTHKILTGRRGEFSTLRQENGLSGFTRPGESAHDLFVSGHASTSISLALGAAQAKRIAGREGYAVAIIGDGAMTGGLAFEGLNNAGRTKDKLIVVLNDNKMSISRNVGSMPRVLGRLRSKSSYVRFKRVVERGASGIPLVGRALRNILFNTKEFFKHLFVRANMFEELGFHYLGPVDGHNLSQLIDSLEAARAIERPVLLHVRTTKGKGYHFAEKKPRDFHGVGSFDINTGDKGDSQGGFSAQMGQALCRLAEQNPRICAVTAAMAEGTGLSDFSRKYRNRFFDVGIAEGHAVTFCAGLAQQGMLPVFAVYSTFLQRSIDQIIHDLAIAGLDCILAVDRAGIVGDDGETHQGIFDVALLSAVPNVTIYSPATYAELDALMDMLSRGGCGVSVVRYPRGSDPALPAGFAFEPDRGLKPYTLYKSGAADTLLVGYGRTFSNIALCHESLSKMLPCHVLKINRLSPANDSLLALMAGYRNIFFFEEGIKQGGTGALIGAALLEDGYSGEYVHTAIDHTFVPHMPVDRALHKLMLDPEGIAEVISQRLLAEEDAKA